MANADEIHQLRPGLYFWQAYEPAVKTDLSCAACLTEGGLVFIDPVPLGKAAEAELLAAGKPRAILLTSGNHARAAAECRERYSIPIYAHAEAVPEFPFAVDHTVADGETVLDQFAVTALSGAAAGEIALHHGDVLHVGDALIHDPTHGFTLLPDKYCTDPAELRRSLEKLLRFQFEVMTFAHGLPIVFKARQRLAHLVA